MQYKIGKCTGCDRDRPLINRKYNQCQDCNRKRLHPKESSTVYYRQQGSIKPKSDKQREIDAKLAEVYKEIDNEREYICTGCGIGRFLSHSHIIPRSQRRDLITEKKNITWHCEDRFGVKGCHSKWEHGDMDERKQLLDYEHNMAYVKSVDLEKYYLWGGE